MASPPNPNLFSRLPGASAVDSDIYDKLTILQQQLETASTKIQQAQSTAEAAQAAIAASASGGGGGLKPSLAFVPVFNPLPDANPTGGAPYAQDGVLIELSPSGSTAGTLYRYDETTFAWIGPLLGSLLIDTHANRTNYSAVDYPSLLFYETDRRYLYRSNGTAWIWMGGICEDTKVNRPSDLVANDAGALFLATDWNVAWRWNGTTWIYAWGIYSAVFASRPATLGAGDAGFLFLSTDTKAIYYWNGSSWVTIAQFSVLVLAERNESGATYTLTTSDFSVVGTRSGTQTFTLPDAVAGTGQVYAVKKVAGGSGAITLNTTSSQTIDGASTLTLQPTDSVLVQSNGSNWVVLALYRTSSTTILVLAQRTSTSTSLTVTSADFNVTANISSGPGTITMPDATTVTGQLFSLKCAATATQIATVGTVSSQTIDGVSAYALNPGDAILLQSDGANWLVLADVRAATSGAWTNYTTTTSNLTGVSKDSAYRQDGKTVFVRITVTGTSNGSNPTVSLPVAPATNGATLAVALSSGGGSGSGAAIFASSTVTIWLYNGSAFAAATSYTLTLTGCYEAA